MKTKQKMGKLFRIKHQDDKLVQQCVKGDSGAQKMLYDRFSQQMFTVCRRYAGNREDAEEVLSNGFIKAFEKLEQFKGDGPLGGWLRTIMVREALNFIRYRKNRFVELEEDRNQDLGHQRGEAELNARHLMRMVEELPLGYRTVFNLYAVEGYNHREIGEMLDISENTSKSQLSKARKALQERINKEEKHIKKLSNE